MWKSYWNGGGGNFDSVSLISEFVVVATCC